MDYSAHSDQELLLIFQSGNRKAFDTLFYRHWSPLFAIARRILEDNDRAKDTIQEAFISLFQQAALKEITHVKTYLYQAVKFQCFMQLRSGRISDKHLARLQTVYAANDVEEQLNAQELDKLLRREIDSLPDRCREVFYLSRYEMLSNKRIAEQLNISQKTVEHQISKALKTLRLSIGKLVLLALLIIS